MTHEERFDRRREIAEFCRLGGSPREACDRFQVCPATVKNACVQAGVQLNTPGGTVGASTLRIVRLLLDGHPPKAICIELGITRQRVSAVKEKAIEAGFTFPEGE